MAGMELPLRHLEVMTAADLRMNRHDPLDIVEFVKNSIDTRFTWGPSIWMDTFVALVDGGADLQRVRKAAEEGKKLMSKIFFSGSLDDVSLSFVDGLLANEDSYGVTYGYGEFVNIELDPLPEVDVGKSPGKMVACILLHEMCHAMLKTYSCSNKYCNDRECAKNRPLHTGVKGHGLAWNLVAHAVEKAAEVHFTEPFPLSRVFGTSQEAAFLKRYGDILVAKRIWGDVDPRPRE